jgi:hypothetical protein
VMLFSPVLARISCPEPRERGIFSLSKGPFHFSASAAGRPFGELPAPSVASGSGTLRGRDPWGPRKERGSMSSRLVTQWVNRSVYERTDTHGIVSYSKARGR